MPTFSLSKNMSTVTANYETRDRRRLSLHYDSDLVVAGGSGLSRQQYPRPRQSTSPKLQYDKPRLLLGLFTKCKRAARSQHAERART
ncbi:hypothetical protein NPX13_g10213 [Xylaria arbuscula]|uniref:Uncharacterized protein n=1 Tax=Xylaria arbuscula TaxID=114810 RepID=A0A9W8N4Z3_9PEZI|nr:hypothetical protein NPX13_g10213 [Xylaria arbuscula]